ncbi:MAG TPA: hypothetical protein VGG33_11725 [Polyangia bacterium]
MSTSEVAVNGGDSQPRYRRKLRNYLIDVGLQIRYTAVITGIALTLTAVLGYQIIKAAQDTSTIIQMTGLVDPAAAGELQQQFAANDRRVLLVIVGFGFLLVLSTMAVGIWITHKVAGPLYSIEGICARVRDNKLHPSLRQKLRKGDELKDFYETFREMYEALRTRADRDMTTLNDVITRLERSGANPEVLEILRKLRAEKAASLEP